LGLFCRKKIEKKNKTISIKYKLILIKLIVPMSKIIKFTLTKKKKNLQTYKLTSKVDKIVKYHLNILNTKPIDFTNFLPKTIKRKDLYEIYFYYWFHYYKKKTETMTEKELSKLGEMFLPICEDRKSTFADKVKKIYYSVNKLRIVKN